MGKRDPGRVLDTLYIVAEAPLRQLCANGDGLLAAAIAIKLRRVYGKPLTPEQSERLAQVRALVVGLLAEVHAEELDASGEGLVVRVPPPTER